MWLEAAFCASFFTFPCLEAPVLPYTDTDVSLRTQNGEPDILTV